MRKLGALLGVLFAVLSACAIGQESAAPAAPAVAPQQLVYKLIEREVFVRAPPGVDFSAQTARLEGLDVVEVYFSTPGKHPLVLLTHGTSDSQIERTQVTPWAYAEQALWFARRGYFAIIVVRSGYGRSSGIMDVAHRGCGAQSEQFQDIANVAADDLRLVVDFARKLPEVDSTTIVGAGVSTGGFAQLALVADPPRGLKAAVGFAGGIGHDDFGHNCNLPVATDSFRAFGKGARKHGDLPILWIFAQNDRWYPPYMVKQFEDAYRGAGGASQLVMAPPDGTDGHDLFSHVPAWSGIVDAFLKANNLLPLGGSLLAAPNPSLTPMPPSLSRANAAAWQQFLLAPPIKTLVVDSDGATWTATGEFDQPSADHDAMEECRKAHKNNRCAVAARNSGID
jgi:dienelactone hydrolase